MLLNDNLNQYKILPLLMKFTFWCYLESELLDLLPQFEKIFPISNIQRDYENVWEWLESNGNDFNLNVSRSHNWKTGDYDDPIKIEISSENLKVEDYYGNLFLQQFKTTIYFGELSHDDLGKNSISARIIKVYKYFS